MEILVGTTVISGTAGVYVLDNGTVTVNANGQIQFKPKPNFSNHLGKEEFTVRVTDDNGDVKTVEVEVDVIPIADAPTFASQGKTTLDDVNVKEDERVALNIDLPNPVDTVDGNASVLGDSPQRIGAITLSITHHTGAKLYYGSDTHEFLSGSSSVQIWISDAPNLHPSNMSAPAGALVMTMAEFRAMEFQPAPHRHENVQLTLRAEGYEVNEAGAVIASVSPAIGQGSMVVYVAAVTDPVTLNFDTSKTAGVTGADAVTYASAKAATVTLKEDTSFKLNELLLATFDDLDGTEVRSISIQNTTGVSILINGTVLAAGGTRTINALTGTSGQTGSITSFADITIGGVGNYSGDLNGIVITLNAHDVDSDGFSSLLPSPGNAATLTDAVTLSLRVTPVAGDISVGAVTTNEDTAVAFLSNVRVNDKDGYGNEVITQIVFDVPTGWQLTLPPADLSLWNITSSGATHTLTFVAGIQAQREAVLDGFMLKPPAHSSLDATVALTITTEDTQTYSTSTPPTATDSVTVTRPVTITVRPVAELTSSDTAGPAGNDVSMNGPHVYVAKAKEDMWFDLNIDAGFKLKVGWNNEDSDEWTFARLTPNLVSGDGSVPNAVGSQFKFSDGTTEYIYTYAGGANSNIWIPVQYLDTLQFKAIQDFSGTFAIEVNAVTLDYDDDTAHERVFPTGWNLTSPNTDIASSTTLNAQTSGRSWLTNIVVEGVADEITLALNGHTRGKEDERIKLDIRATSSDSSEQITLNIENIPVGATVYYTLGGVEYAFVSAAGATTLTLHNYNGASGPKDLYFQGAPNASGEYTLNVTAQSTENDINGNPSQVYNLPVKVSVEAVADDATITLAPAQSFTEAALDAGSKIYLSQLISAVVSPDTDGSEAVTVRVSGLAEGFELNNATLLSAGTGTARVWSLSVAQLSTVSISAPPNFSGAVSFQVQGVTTEKGALGGDSKTGPSTTVNFTVTASPEALTTVQAQLLEDVQGSLGFGIAHQNGDTDETLQDVWILQADVLSATYTLYADAGSGLIDLSSWTITEDIGGQTYYKLTQAQASTLQAKGGAHLDGTLGSFNFKYQIQDAHYGTVASAPMQLIKDGVFTITARPVTDIPVPVINSIGGTQGTTLVNGTNVIVVDPERLTVNLNITSPDQDGSEHIIRVQINNVPDGISVDGAALIAPETWLLSYEFGKTPAPLTIGASGLSLPINFYIGLGIANGDHTITIQVQAQDRGNTATPADNTEVAQVSFQLNANLTGPGVQPVQIVEWQYNGVNATEDTPFTLDSIIDAEVENVLVGADQVLTVTLSDLPPGLEFEGLTRTEINGEVILSAKILVPAGGDAGAALAALLSSIKLTPTPNTNSNNAPGDLNFTATLTSSVVGGLSVSQTINNNDLVVPVTPVTDPAGISFTTTDVDEGQSSFLVTLDTNNLIDGLAGKIVDGIAYVKVDADPSNAGALTLADGTALSLSTHPDFLGYYEVNVGEQGGSVDLRYTANGNAPLNPGDVTFSGVAVTHETGSTPLTSSITTATTEIVVVNNGVSFTHNPIRADEINEVVVGNRIELTGALGGLNVTLNDNDGSEVIKNILLSNVPVGFLVYAGADAASATAADLSNNAGGDGSTNTWVLAQGSVLPAYVLLSCRRHIGVVSYQGWR